VVEGFSPAESATPGGGRIAITARFLASKSSAGRISALIGEFACPVDSESFVELMDGGAACPLTGDCEPRRDLWARFECTVPQG